MTLLDWVWVWLVGGALHIGYIANRVSAPGADGDQARADLDQLVDTVKEHFSRNQVLTAVYVMSILQGWYGVWRIVASWIKTYGKSKQ